MCGAKTPLRRFHLGHSIPQREEKEKRNLLLFSGIFFLVRHQLLHEQVIDTVQLLVAVQRGQLLLAVHHDGLEDHKAQILLVGLVLLHSGEEEIGRASSRERG